MAKLWAGRTDGQIDDLADQLNSSLKFDKRMYSQDITGSIAHAKMLGKQNIIDSKDAELIVKNLKQILEDLNSGDLEFDYSCEDIHMFVEQVLTDRIGDAGKKLHTARSRNDQVALDIRMYLRDKIDEISDYLLALIDALCDKAEEYKDAVLPGYTHLQRAQPINFGHHLLAYCMMFERDYGRMIDCKKRMNICPIGSCALAGTTYDTDRFYEAELLGFDGVCQNSIDGVSDRDFCLELLSDLSILMTHLSRLSEELILWSSWEFRFVKISDDFTTGSSIMPQKKNPDMAELVRGKTGRVFGDLHTLLTTLKGIPLAYNKDMQEDKEAIFDAIDTVELCLRVYAPMISKMEANREAMLKAASEGFINATDLADYLTKKGIPFRTAYKISGKLVAYCSDNNKVLDELTIDEFKNFSEDIEEDIYTAIDLNNCVNTRISFGGTSFKSAETQIEYIRDFLNNCK